MQGDHLGSASMTTDANGAKTSEYRYTPYGGVRVAWGNLPTNRKFTGYAREDAIGGIDFAQARYYDSVIGRWLSADVNYDGGLEDPQGLNRYSYVKGHAMNAIDPTGKQCLISLLCPPPAVVKDTNVTPAVDSQDSVIATIEAQPTATATPSSPSSAATQQAKATPTPTATATRALEAVTVYRMVRPDKISLSSFGYDDKSDVEPRGGISVYEELPPGAVGFPMQVIYKGPKESGRVGVIVDPKLQDMGAAAMYTPLAGGLPGAKGHWSIVLQSPITDERKAALKNHLSDTAKQHFKGLKSQ